MADITSTPGNDELKGSTGNDTLRGLEGDDTLYGAEGNDVLRGGPGADTLDGEDGWDVARYLSSNAAVTVNLATGDARGGHAEGDTLISIENLTGSDRDDVLTGDGGHNVLESGAGASGQCERVVRIETRLDTIIPPPVKSG